MNQSPHILFLNQIGIQDITKVGGKNASLGEMYNRLMPLGIQIPPGFALTAAAFRLFMHSNQLEQKIVDLLQNLDIVHFSNLTETGEKARSLITKAEIPSEIIEALREAYTKLCEDGGKEEIDVAVRSSATAEDLPGASFAGRMESFLNITGFTQLLKAVQLCFASLYTDRAIKYRYDMGFAETDIAISVGVQQMVRSDLASSGVAFTLDPDSGFKNVIVLNGCWGLGENIVQGRITPDEWILFKPTLAEEGLNPILKRHCGKKEFTMRYHADSTKLEAEKTIVNEVTTAQKQTELSLSDAEVIQLGRWCDLIEKHYHKPMDIEWAKDGLTQQLFIVQARPETIHSKGKKKVREIYTLQSKIKPDGRESKLLCKGIALGDKIASGKARIILNPEEAKRVAEGEIVVTDITNPDWDPVLKKAAAIITNKGGRTSHAAIVARELGTVAVVGCGNATREIVNGQEITVSCAEGKEGMVYDGILEWQIKEQDFSRIAIPETSPMLILADPSRAFELSNYPTRGVGLMRLEFAISNTIKIHPLALIEPEKIMDSKVQSEISELTKDFQDGKEYFIHKLAEAVSMVAAAFFPNDVIVRMSDFKSNEYANLLGGSYFEPQEENPMIGLRGASRYYSDFYRKGFALECEAMKKVRNEMGMKNVKLMIPFCRTVDEGKMVLAEMAANGLKQKDNGLEIYVMVEIPSNVLLADEFAKLFDGFSIGSNDLTQLTLGLDRDSALVNHLFNEENPAVLELIKQTILAAKRNKIKVGLCGQAPSDIPGFAQFLVDQKIDSISFNPDVLIKGIENILEAERRS